MLTYLWYEPSAQISLKFRIKARRIQYDLVPFEIFRNINIASQSLTDTWGCRHHVSFVVIDGFVFFTDTGLCVFVWVVQFCNGIPKNGICSIRLFGYLTRSCKQHIWFSNVFIWGREQSQVIVTTLLIGESLKKLSPCCRHHFQFHFVTETFRNLIKKKYWIFVPGGQID